MRVRAAGIVLSCAVLASTSQLHGDVQVVALSDQLSPDGQPFGGRFMLPAINANGQLLIASAPNESFSSRQGIWVGAPGQLTTVVRPHDPIPGMAEKFEFIYDSNLDDAGRVMLVTTTGSHYPGLWAGLPGNLQTLAYQGTSNIAGAPGFDVGGTDNVNPRLSRNGTAVFRVYGDPSYALVTGTPGNLAAVALSNQTPPGMPAGYFYQFDTIVPAIDAQGRIAFSSSAVNIIGADALQGIWSSTNGTTSLIARQDAIAPGTAGGATFSSLSNLTIASGQIAFGGSLQGAGVLPINDTAVWAGPTNAPALVAREGDAIPSTPFLLGQPNGPVVNPSGTVAFTGALFGPALEPSSDEGIFIASPGQLRLIAWEGAIAPDTGGAVFTSFNAPSINALGQLAFLATLSGNQDAIFATDASGSLLLLAREGMTLDLGGGLQGTVASLGMISGSNAGEDGSRSAFNNLGQVAFRAIFDDGRSAVLVATVPEPAAGTLLFAGGLLAFRRRKNSPPAPARAR